MGVHSGVGERVPPDVPYENYLYYLEKVREIWGKGLNLKPMAKEALREYHSRSV